MWMFYAIGLPLTLGMVVATLRYFAGPDVSRYVLTAVGYTWFCSLSIIVLVPADIWTTLENGNNSGINLLWSWSYWSTFCLTWLIVPLLQGYEDAGDFTFAQRLKTSIHVNLVFYLSVGSVGLLGIAILLILHKLQWNRVMGLAIACSNTFGLVTGAFLLGFGLLEIPRSIWRNANWTYRHKRLSHRVARVAVNLDDAHQELSTAIVIAQATSNQMSRRDPLRPYMDVIDNMLQHMAEEDPSFKPSGGRMGESDMDYDADEKSMAGLRRRLQKARYFYCRFKRYLAVGSSLCVLLSSLDIVLCNVYSVEDSRECCPVHLYYTNLGPLLKLMHRKRLKSNVLTHVCARAHTNFLNSWY